MRIGVQHISIAPCRWDNLVELELFLKRTGQAILLGENAENAKNFYSLSILSEPGGEPLCTIGLLCEGHGLTPEALVFADFELLFVGANSRVSVISWKHGSVIAETDLGFLFRSFVPKPSEGVVLATHETGVDAFSLGGQRLWQFHRDVVEEIRLTEACLEMHFMDAGAARIDIHTGREMSD